MACARALVLINYQRAGIAATSAYYLEANTGPEAPLSGPRFHRRGPVLSIVPTTTTTTSNYSVYRTKTLSQQACSIRRLSAAPPRRISAPYGPCYLLLPSPLPFPTSTAFTTRSLPLSSCFSFLATDSRSRFSALLVVGVDKMPGRVSNRLARLEKRVRGSNGMGEEGGTWQNDTSRPPLRYVQAIARPAPLGPGQIINPRVLTPFAS